MTKKEIRKGYLAILIVALIILLPIFIALPQQAQDRTLILAFGIDKMQEQYEVSAQIMVPESSQSGYKEKREVKSSVGKTIDQAIASLQLNEGKDIGVAHANILIINEQAIGEDINSVLDYFIRNRDIGYLTIATTPNSAKEMLEISANSTSDKDSLLRLVSYNNENIFGTDSTLNKLLFGYYSPAQTSIISRLQLSSSSSQSSSQASTQNSTNEQSGSGESQSSAGESSSGQQQSSQPMTAGNSQSDSSGQSSGSSSGQSSGSSSEQSSQGGSQSSKQILNDGSVVVLKSGKVVVTLDPLQYRGFHWLMPTKSSSFIELNNINNEYFKDATVVLDIINSKESIEYEITSDNIPIIKFNTELEYSISSIQQSDYNADIYAESMNDSTDAISKALQNLIDSEVQGAINLSKQYQIDILNIYDKFHQKYGNKFDKIVQFNEGDYLRDVEVYVNVKVKENKI